MKYLRFLLLICLCAGCIKEVQFKGEPKNAQLVVDGKITNYGGEHVLKLTKSVPLDTATYPVVGAQVKIMDDQGNSEDYQEFEAGVYHLAGNVVKGIPGRTYTISIRLQDGSDYLSYPETMPEPVHPDSLTFGFSDLVTYNENQIAVTTKMIDLFIHSPVNSSGPTFFRWEMDDAFMFTELPHGPLNVFKTCYFTDQTDPYRIKYFGTQNTPVSYLSNYLIARMPIREISFRERHYFSAVQLTLTKNAFHYWDRLSQISTPQGTIFDKPPAAVQGNVYNVNKPDEVVLGYFEAAPADTIRTFVVRGYLHFYLRDPCEFSSGYFPGCFECTVIQNNWSLTKPYYWYP